MIVKWFWLFLIGVGLLLLSVKMSLLEARRTKERTDELIQLREEAKRAKADRDNIVRLTAGGWKFEKHPPPDPIREMEYRIAALEELYQDSLIVRKQVVRDKSLSLMRCDQRIQEWADKLAKHREELERLKKEIKP